MCLKWSQKSLLHTGVKGSLVCSDFPEKSSKKKTLRFFSGKMQLPKIISKCGLKLNAMFTWQRMFLPVEDRVLMLVYSTSNSNAMPLFKVCLNYVITSCTMGKLSLDRNSLSLQSLKTYFKTFTAVMQ